MPLLVLSMRKHLLQSHHFHLESAAHHLYLQTESSKPNHLFLLQNPQIMLNHIHPQAQRDVTVDLHYHLYLRKIAREVVYSARLKMGIPMLLKEAVASGMRPLLLYRLSPRDNRACDQTPLMTLSVQ
jgi:hypothetical protein